MPNTVLHAETRRTPKTPGVLGVICVSVLMCVQGWSGAAGAQERKPQVRDTRVVELIAQARALPAELGADVLLRLPALAHISDTAWKREIIDDAFHLAAAAKEPYRRTRVIILYHGNSRSGYLSQAYDFNLDSLSLQGRAVRMMLPLDRAAAMALFGEMRMPQLAPATCADVFLPLMADFYTDTVGDVLKEGFTAEQLRQGQHVQLLERLIGEARSPEQIGPLAGLLAEVNVTPPQFAALVEAFTGALVSVQFDPRSAPLIGEEVFSIGKLVEACKHAASCSSAGLLNAYRAYVVAGLSHARCGDSGEPAEVTLIRTSSMINTARAPGDPLLPIIRPEEVKAEVLPDKAGEPRFWQDPVSAKLLAELDRLRARPAPGASSSDWETRFNDYLSAVDNWNGESEKSAMDFFHQKCVLLEGALAIATAGNLHDRALSDYVLFLSQSEARLSSPIEWYLHANTVIQELQNGDGNVRRRAIAALGNSPDAVFWLYAQLAPENFTLAPRPAPASR